MYMCLPRESALFNFFYDCRNVEPPGKSMAANFGGANCRTKWGGSGGDYIEEIGGFGG